MDDGTTVLLRRFESPGRIFPVFDSRKGFFFELIQFLSQCLTVDPRISAAFVLLSPTLAKTLQIYSASTLARVL